MRTLLWYPKCSTCKNAKSFLDEQGISYNERDIKNENPKVEEIEKWIEKYQLDIKKLYNTSGIIYKENNLKEKLPKMNIHEKIRMLSKSGMLVKRPILIEDDFILIGFKRSEWEEKLCKKN